MSENWEKVREIFDAALALPADERGAFVAGACGGDESIASEVASLLASHDSADDFLEAPAASILAADAESARVASGTRIGRYEVSEMIAEGGMGEVYRARDLHLDRQVAIKLLASDSVGDAGRIRREALATSALNHPNIVTIHETGKFGDRTFLVTELVDGVTIRDRLRQGPLPEDEAVDIATQTAAALAAAHEAGVVHRDVKPENLMIRADGIVKVLDFGIAKFRPADGSGRAVTATEAGEIIGTAAYMSPEQARGLAVDARTDVWSLGVVLYEMLAGRGPFDGETHSDRLAAILVRDPAPLPAGAATARVARIVARALAKDRDDRYDSMNAMLADLRESAQAPRGAGRGRGRMIAVAAAGLALVIAAVWGVRLFYPSPARPVAAAEEGRKSIAVLPLRPINSAARDELYEIGIADALIQRLGAMKTFTVPALQKVRRYADGNIDPLTAGRELSVDYVLVSNYQLAGGRIRVTSQLLRVADGAVEETYKSEREAGDIFALQDGVGEDIGQLMQAKFMVAAANAPVRDRAGTTNEEAYRLYLRGIFLVERGGADNVKRSMDLFDRALTLDPNYAKAWAGKARAHCYFSHVGDRTPDEEYAIAKPSLERAFALNADLPEAYAVLAVTLNDYDWKFSESKANFKRALDLAPNSEFSCWYSYRLAQHGEIDEAIAVIKRAIDLSPNSVFEQYAYGQILYLARRYDDATAQFQHVLELDPTFTYVHFELWHAFHMKGDYERAFEAFMAHQRSEGAKEQTLARFNRSHAAGGWPAVLREYQHFLVEEVKTGSAFYVAARCAAWTGDQEKAITLLVEAVRRRSALVPGIGTDPAFESLQLDPRFREIVNLVK